MTIVAPIATSRGGQVVRRMVRADVAADRAAVAHLHVGDLGADLADVQVRNRGTIGGNVCSNDPTNHLPPSARRDRRDDEFLSQRLGMDLFVSQPND